MRLITLILSLMIPLLYTDEIVVQSSDGNAYLIEIEANASFEEVIKKIQQEAGSFTDYMVAIDSSDTPLLSKHSQGSIRNYFAPITPTEKDDISKIVNTLGMSPYSTITKSESALKKAGDRIDHIHPLRFLLCIFQDDVMKASIAAMQNRWVWGKFISGLKGHLEEEANRENLKIEYIHDLAGQLGIHPDLLYPSIVNHSWEQFVTLLIKYVPRNENANRYDI